MRATTGVILAAGFGTRLRGVSDQTELKPLTLVGGLPLLQRAVRSLEVAGCARVVVVVGHGKQDVIDSLEGYRGEAEIVFADNPRFDLKNGVSVLAARPYLLSGGEVGDGRFILSMADHVLGDEVMRLAGAHTPPEHGATLLVDWKLASIFDMDDATKVLAVDAGLGPAEKRIEKIGKMIPEYNCVDCGVFVCTTALMDRIAERYAAHSDASLSEGVQALSDTGRMTVLDIGDGFWQDVDTPEMLAHAEAELRAPTERERMVAAMMNPATDDTRIKELRPLISAAILLEEIPISAAGERLITDTRDAVANAVRGTDDRLVVVVGPCSIHDVGAAKEYAKLLKAEVDRHAGELIIVMRVYFEKPRTTVGWKGLINDPSLDGSFQINKGLRMARQLLADLAETGVPAGCEFLDAITPQYVADLVTWGAIGARTTESQVHRELASGLSVPVGFKNGTSGAIDIAVEAVMAASHPHTFLSVTKQGIAAIVHTRGNDACHIILRGGKTSGPNYQRDAVDAVAEQLAAKGLAPRVMVDASHGNSDKDHRRQPLVVTALAEQVASGSEHVFGLMLESHLVAGRQDQKPGLALTYGQSITDACIGWDETVPCLAELAAAVKARRARRAAA